MKDEAGNILGSVVPLTPQMISEAIKLDLMKLRLGAQFIGDDGTLRVGSADPLAS